MVTTDAFIKNCPSNALFSCDIILLNRFATEIKYVLHLEFYLS